MEDCGQTNRQKGRWVLVDFYSEN